MLRQLDLDLALWLNIEINQTLSLCPASGSLLFFYISDNVASKCRSRAVWLRILLSWRVVVSTQELLVLFLHPLLIGWHWAKNSAGPCKLPVNEKKKKTWEGRERERQRERETEEKDRGGVGREEEKARHRIFCLYCNSSWYDSWFFLIFERNSNRKATLINKANVQISGLGIKLIEIYISFISRVRLKHVWSGCSFSNGCAGTFYIRFESDPLLTLLCANRVYCTLQTYSIFFFFSYVN